MRNLLLICLTALALAGPGRVFADCQPSSIGVDPSLATSSTATSLGDAFGQVITVGDTLVSSITIWRSFFIDSSSVGVHLFVANVDSLGRPDPQDLVLDGPTVFHVVSDSVHPTPFTFAFDPPLALPHAGKYELLFQASPCCSSFFFIYREVDTYPGGSLWWNDPSCGSSCRLRPSPTPFANQDLVFRVEFCGQGTAAVGTSWGRVKDRYR